MPAARRLSDGWPMRGPTCGGKRPVKSEPKMQRLKLRRKIQSGRRDDNAEAAASTNVGEKSIKGGESRLRRRPWSTPHQTGLGLPQRFGLGLSSRHPDLRMAASCWACLLSASRSEYPELRPLRRDQRNSIPPATPRSASSSVADLDCCLESNLLTIEGNGSTRPTAMAAIKGQQNAQATLADEHRGPSFTLRALGLRPN